MTCPLCHGTRQAFPLDVDVGIGEITIHADNSCPACEETPHTRYPFLIWSRGYRCQQACEPRSVFVQVASVVVGLWATYRCVSKNHLWDRAVTVQDYAVLASRPAPAQQEPLEL